MLANELFYIPVVVDVVWERVVVSADQDVDAGERTGGSVWAVCG